MASRTSVELVNCLQLNLGRARGGSVLRIHLGDGNLDLGRKITLFGPTLGGAGGIGAVELAGIAGARIVTTREFLAIEAIAADPKAHDVVAEHSHVARGLGGGRHRLQEAAAQPAGGGGIEDQEIWIGGDVAAVIGQGWVDEETAKGRSRGRQSREWCRGGQRTGRRGGVPLHEIPDLRDIAVTRLRGQRSLPEERVRIGVAIRHLAGRRVDQELQVSLARLVDSLHGQQGALEFAGDVIGEGAVIAASLRVSVASDPGAARFVEKSRVKEHQQREHRHGNHHLDESEGAAGFVSCGRCWHRWIWFRAFARFVSH